MKVCIAEKPSVAREIAQVLGAKTRKDGYFEGNGYAVTWTFGHFCTLKEPDEYQAHWKKWDFNSLPMLPEKFETKLIKNQGVKKQFGIIKKLFKSAEVVINCGDAGQEGELIQRWVLKEAKYRGKVLRLWISSLTTEAIKDGFKNLQNASQFDNLYFAGFSRAIGDWILGMNATRLYTLKYGGFKQLLSVGRVQTPTLAMLVERHHEIENFKPEPYWELQTVYREVTFNYEKGRFLKKEDGEAMLDKVKNKTFTIVSVVKKNGREAPPRLFDLTSLQVHCNKRFSYTADQTLKIAQKLYEQKVITYPRVDTTYLPNDIYPKVPSILKKMSSYRQFVQPLIGKKIKKSGKVFNDKKVTDHHAIIPTGFEKNNLQPQERNVYDAIARRFIAAFYPDCLVAKTTVIGEVDGLKFKAFGKEILEEGWRVLFPKPKKSNTFTKKETEDSRKKKEEEEKILPEFKKGESGPHDPTLVEKITQPPKTYSEATLLRAMETAGKNVDDDELRDLMKANGIGRPSTRAAIIETLFRRKYIRRKRKQVVPTETGIALIGTIKNPLLKSAELTGQWEKHLRDIEKGEYSAKVFVDNMKVMVGKLVEEVRLEKNVKQIVQSTNSSFSKRSSSKTKRAKSTKVKKVENATCPKCKQGVLLKGNSAYGCSRYQEDCSFRLPFIFMGKEIPEKQLLRLLEYGGTIQLAGFKKDGKKVKGNLKFNDNFELFLKEKEERKVGSQQLKKTSTNSKQKNQDSIPCPKCGIGKVIKGKTAYGCSTWQNGCTWRFSFDEVRRQAAGKTMTKALVSRILNGKS
ncbi:MAG: DNA topoisomerase 3 [Bacteroidota bacterium]